MQATRDWTGMMERLDRLIPTLDPTSYDLALVLDMKAKLHATQGARRKAIEAWEQALRLSEQFGHFDAKTAQHRLHRRPAALPGRPLPSPAARSARAVVLSMKP